jgi:hypothetical protein
MYATDPHTLAMAAIGGTVAVASAVAPRRLLRLFGIPDAQTTGAAVLGWRLMAVRTGAVSLLAARGDATARDLFLPVQLADQAAWWWGHRRGELSLRTAVLAATASGAIVALDLRRRTRPPAPPA